MIDLFPQDQTSTIPYFQKKAHHDASSILYLVSQKKAYPGFAIHVPRNHPRKGSWPEVGIHRNQTASGDQSTGHVHHLIRRKCARTTFLKRIVKGLRN